MDLNILRQDLLFFHFEEKSYFQVITIPLDTENSKWQISEKKALKLPRFQKPISQEPFGVKKILLTFVSH